MWKNKWPKIVKLGGGATIGRFVLFDLKIYYRATVIKLYSFDESIHTQINGINLSSEIDTHKKGQMIFDKGAQIKKKWHIQQI